MRDELLAIEQFASLLEAQVLVGDWRTEYNTYRPHSDLDGLTPADYAEQREVLRGIPSLPYSLGPFDPPKLHTDKSYNQMLVCLVEG